MEFLKTPDRKKQLEGNGVENVVATYDAIFL